MSRTRSTSLTTIALACGFSSLSDFSRCFKQRFGVPPGLLTSRPGEAHGDKLNAIVAQASKLSHIDRLPPRHNPDSFRVKIRDVPARTVAYIRVDKPYQGNGVIKAVETLVAWAERNGFADGQWLGYQWDDPEITSLEDCRYYVAVEAERFTPKGEVVGYHFPPMTVAEVAIRGGLDLELRFALALRLVATKEWIRSGRPPLLRSLDWPAVCARDRILRASRAIADPPALRSRALAEVRDCLGSGGGLIVGCSVSTEFGKAPLIGAHRAPYKDPPGQLLIETQKSNALSEGCPHTNPTRERGDRLCIGNRPWPASLARVGLVWVPAAPGPISTQSSPFGGHYFPDSQ